MSDDFYIRYIEPYKGIIVKICKAYTNTQEDFDDYYQEICLQLWRSRDNFSGKSKWSTWMYQVSLNVCMSLLRKKEKHNSYYSSELIPDNQNDDNFYFFSDQDLNELYKAIKKLSEIDRAIILLYLEEKTSKEIAYIIGINANNVRVRISRIKKRLKELLDGKVD